MCAVSHTSMKAVDSESPSDDRALDAKRIDESLSLRFLWFRTEVPAPESLHPQNFPRVESGGAGSIKVMCCTVARTGVCCRLLGRKSLCRRFSAVWTTDAPCRSCCSMRRRRREGLEARTDRSSQKQNSPSGVRSTSATDALPIGN